jgi:hypothetical protein
MRHSRRGYGRRRTSVTRKRAHVLEGALAGGRKVSNRAKGKLEVHRFLEHPPERLFAYYSGDARVGDNIHTWMGDRLGTIVHRGKETRPLGGRVVNIRVRGINGFLYAGRCNLSSGTYCNLRKMATQPRHSRHRDRRRRR